MASILKPRNLPPGITLERLEGFNWEDVLAKAREHLEKIRAQAHELIEAARVEADAIKQAAREDGKKAAQADLESLAQKQAANIASEKINASIQSLEQFSEQLEQVTENWLRQWQHETIPLVIVIAERLVRRQIDIDPTILLQWISDGIALARAERNVQIRIHPNDRSLLGPHLDQFVSRISQKQKVEVIEDSAPAIPRNHYSAEDLEIDAQLKSQLERLSEEMR